MKLYKVVIICVVLTSTSLIASSILFRNRINIEVLNTDKIDSINTNNHKYAKNIVKPKEGQPIKHFMLVAIESYAQIKSGFQIPVWTYNGSVPGKEIRVTQGDFVRVKFKNMLNTPTTIHWHGYPVNSVMDGIPGISQDSIKSGETFEYDFSADEVGTYWYHSHQESSKQVDKGLYGALIVEPKIKNYDKDFTLFIDEWMDKEMDDDMTSMNKIKKINKKNVIEETLIEENSMRDEYNIQTINGKSGNLIRPIYVEEGDKIRLRIINAGYRSHGIHIPNKDIKVVSTDGQEIIDPEFIKDQIVNISPGERYDIEFTMDSTKLFKIDFHDNNKYNEQLKIPVEIIGREKNYLKESNSILEFDLVKYGKKSNKGFQINQMFDVTYNIILNSIIENDKLKYTINGRTYENQLNIEVKKDYKVKIIFENKSEVDHPMHLHGHFFQLLSKNGTEYNSLIMKDTLLVKPHEKYEVAFLANNPGLWVEHCHELHHAAAGMMQKIIYTDYVSNYKPDLDDLNNKPE